MDIRIWPYKLGSQGAENLSTALRERGMNCLRVRSHGRYRPKSNQLILNWGNSCINPPSWWLNARAEQILNFPDKVSIASNKLSTFQQLYGYEVSIPIFSTIKQNIIQFIEEGKKIYCRTKLTDRGGDGIVVARTVEELVDAPLYTVGINTWKEYRVHIFDGQVIDITQKRRRTDADGNPRDCNMDIRNLANDWVFCHGNVNPPQSVMEQSLKAIEALGLDFGAVDVVIDREENTYVLEVNTAPGLNSPQTIEAYVAAIRRYCESRA